VSYDVGTAVLHIVPSFRGLEQALKGMADGLGKNLGDKLEPQISEAATKAVRDAGDKAAGEARKAGRKVAEAGGEQARKATREAGQKVAAEAQKAAAETGEKVAAATQKAAVKAAAAEASVHRKAREAAHAEALRLQARQDKELQALRDGAHAEALRMLADEGKDMRKVREAAHAEALRMVADHGKDMRKVREDAHADALRMVADQAKREQRVRDDAHTQALRMVADEVRQTQRIRDDAHTQALRMLEDQARQQQRAQAAAHTESMREARRQATEQAREAQRAADQVQREFGKTLAGRVSKALTEGAWKLPDIEIDVDTTPAHQAMAGLRADMQALGKARIGIDVDAARARAEIDDMQARAVMLARQSPTIDVQVGALEALTTLKAVREQLRPLDGKDIDVRVDVDAGAAMVKLAALKVALSELEVHTGRLGAILMAVAAFGTGLVPIAAAAVAAVGMLGTALAGLGVGIGVTVLGLSGISDAVKKLHTWQQDMEKTTASYGRNASAVEAANRQIAAAQRAIVNTRADNAYAAKRAAVAIVDADRAVVKAEQAVRRATEEVTRARDKERRAVEDLRLQLRDLAIQQRQAAVDQIEARKDLEKLRDNPRATAEEVEQASIAYDELGVRLDDIAVQQRRAGQDLATANRVGIDGSERVVAAREREAEAVEALALAQRRQAEALESQQRQARQAAHALANAQDALAGAYRSASQAQLQGMIAGGQALDNFEDAMEGLGPAGRRFVHFLYGLRGQLLGIRSAAQENMLPGVQRAIERLLPLVPQLTRFVSAVATEVGSLFDEFSRVVTTDPVFRDFFGYIGDTAVPTLRRLFNIGRDVTKGLLGLFLAFTPLNEPMGQGLEGAAASFARWAEGLRESEGFQEFLAYIREAAPEVLRFLKEAGKFLWEFAVAAAPIGLIVIKILTQVFDWLNNIPTDVLTTLITMLVGFGAVLGVLAIATSVFGMGWAAVVGLIVGVTAGAFIYLYNRFEGFRNFLHGYWNVIGAIYSTVWRGVIRPALMAMVWIFQNVVAPVVTWLYQNIIKPFWDKASWAFRTGATLVKFVAGIIQIAFKAMGLAWASFYRSKVKPIWDLVRPIFTFLGTMFKAIVVPQFEAGMRRMGKVWGWLRDMAKAPVKFVIEQVMNKGLLAGYNKVAKMFKVKPDDLQLDLPPGFAHGGPVRGRGTARSDSILARLSDGEHVWTAQEVAAAGGHRAVSAMRRAAMGAGGQPGTGAGPGDWISSKFRLIGDAFTASKEVLTDPGGALRKLAAHLYGKVPGKDTAAGRLAIGVAKRSVTALVDRIRSMVGADSDVPAGNPSHRAGAMGWQKQMAVLRGVFPGLALHSGFRPGSTTFGGVRDYHSYGRAVDVPPRMDVFQWLRRHFPDSRELIFSPAGGQQIWVGRPHFYTEPVRAQHFDHVHWAYDSGGYLPPGVSTVVNNTGRPEPVLTPGQWAAIERGSHAEARAVENHFHFLRADLDTRRLNAITARQNALARVGRPS